MKVGYVTVVCALGAAVCAAQTATPSVTWKKSTNMFVAMELGSGKVVKGAPYSAQAVSEFEQRLADGNRIFRSNSGMVYRDSEGRTRREQPAGGSGLLGTSVTLPSLVVITDPVAGFTYTLNPKYKTASKTPLPANHASAATGASGGWGIAVNGMAQSAKLSKRVNPENTKNESLGTKNFDGVAAEGTRTVVTTPVGQIGNERPIEATIERWYSQQLQVTVFSQNSDPRTGTTTERLSGISLTEPPHSLFEIPADYTVRDGAGKWFMIKPSQK